MAGLTIFCCAYGFGKNQSLETTAFLYCNNKAARIEYSTELWSLQQHLNTKVKFIQLKTEKKIVAIDLGRVPSLLEQKEYITDFKNYMLKLSKDGNIGEETLNGFPVLSYYDKEKPLKFAVMVVKDGAGYYEITFCCYKSLYNKYKSEAFKVFRSFQILHPKEKVIKDPEIAAGLSALDKSAGYDDEAVRKNLSANGAELVGVWHHKNYLNYTLTFKADGTFQENVKTTTHLEYIEGIWQYDRPTIYITMKKIMIDGKDKSDQIKVPTITYTIRNFDGKTMFVFVPQAFQLRTFIKE